MSYYDATTGEGVRRAFDKQVTDWPGVTTRTSFGCPSYSADGTLFAVLVTEGVVLTRLPQDHRDALDASFETGPFEAGGRTVTSWVRVTVDDPSDLDGLLPFVEQSYEAARAESS